MAQVIVDEALLREPNLWVPGKKPIGHVASDIVPYSRLFLFNTAYPNCTFSAGKATAEKGSIVFQREGAVTSNGNKLKVPASLDPLRLRESATVVLHFKRYGAIYGSYPRVFCSAKTGSWATNTTFSLTRGAGDLLTVTTIHEPINESVTNLTVPSSFWSDGTESVLVFTMEGNYTAGTMMFYLNGSYIGSHTWSNMSVTGSFGVGYILGDIAETTEAYDRYLGAVFYSYHEIYRALPPEQCKSLTRDPYQFLIPA